MTNIIFKFEDLWDEYMLTRKSKNIDEKKEVKNCINCYHSGLEICYYPCDGC